MGLRLQALLCTCLWSHAAGHSLKYVSQSCMGQPATCRDTACMLQDMGRGTFTSICMLQEQKSLQCTARLVTACSGLQRHKA